MGICAVVHFVSYKPRKVLPAFWIVFSVINAVLFASAYTYQFPQVAEFVASFWPSDSVLSPQNFGLIVHPVDDLYYYLLGNTLTLVLFATQLREFWMHRKVDAKPQEAPSRLVRFGELVACVLNAIAPELASAPILFVALATPTAVHLAYLFLLCFGLFVPKLFKFSLLLIMITSELSVVFETIVHLPSLDAWREDHLALLRWFGFGENSSLSSSLIWPIIVIATLMLYQNITLYGSQFRFRHIEFLQKAEAVWAFVSLKLAFVVICVSILFNDNALGFLYTIALTMALRISPIKLRRRECRCAFAC